MSKIQVSGNCPRPASRPAINSLEAQESYLAHFYSKHLGKNIFFFLSPTAHTPPDPWDVLFRLVAMDKPEKPSPPHLP